MNSFVDVRHPERIYETEPLPAWTYLSAELLELEYERVILPSWQFVCHQNHVKEAGDFATLDLWRDSIIVMRGRDGALRAFQNACRHRGSKLLDGEGTCKHRITCPYHAWSYQLDGRLAAVPSEKTFPGLDKTQLGLKELELEVFCGLVFVRVMGSGSSIAEQWGDLAKELAPYRIEEMVPAVGVQISEEWTCNWKVALDNYLDNYHVPFGHPGLHRLMDNELSCTINRHGVSFSKSVVRARLSAPGAEGVRLPAGGRAPDLGVRLHAGQYRLRRVPRQHGHFPDPTQGADQERHPHAAVRAAGCAARGQGHAVPGQPHQHADRPRGQGAVRAGAGRPLQLQLPAGAAQRIRDAGEGHACAHPRRLPDRDAEGAADGRHPAPAEPEDAG